MKRKCTILSMTLFMCVGILIIGKQITENQRIYINEVRSWDADIKRDGYYGSDYMEIYNASKKDISLDGWYISDDKSNLKKDQIFEVTVPAKGFAVLYANGKKNSGDSLNFKINPEGEEIFLSDGEGNLVDSIYVPKQEFGTVYARVNDGGKEWAVMESSILESNNEKEILPAKSLKEPQFSHESGFYEEKFTLTLQAEPGETIYYTTDGSIPDKTSKVYENGIEIENISDQPNVINAVRNIRKDWSGYFPDTTPVDKAVVIRAVAMQGEGQKSEVVTKTYFVGQDEYLNKNVLSITANYDDLFGDDGIFVTGKDYDEKYLSGELDEDTIANIFRSGRKWEVIGNLEFLESGKEASNQKIGIRIQGRSSREGKKKRMRLYARKEYSEDQYLRNIFFDEQEAHALVSSEDKTSALLQSLVKDRNVAAQGAEEVDIFLNGEFYYTGCILERYDKYYLQDHFGVNKENVMLVKDGNTAEGDEAAGLLYGELLNFVRTTDCSDALNYELLQKQIDMQSYIDYLCINAYLCNIDLSDTHNCVLWRTKEIENSEKGDARWRWMLYDIDCVLWVHPEYYEMERKSQINSFTMKYTEEALIEQAICKSVINNEDFRKQFAITFMDLANVNFSIENVEKQFQELGAEIEDYGTFFTERFDYIVPYMAEEFELAGSLENVTLKVNDPSGGTIQLNTTVPNLSQGSWTGKYYTDYPVSVTAIPAEGYRFVGWQGSEVSEEMTLETEVAIGGITLEAVFEKK